MKSRGNVLLIVLIVLGILVAVGSMVLKGSRPGVTTTAEQDKRVGNEIATVTSGPSNQAADGRYVEYASGTLDMYAGQRRVLYFYANWCPTCRPADAEFKANANQIPDRVVLIRVNYNDSDTDSEEEQLATKYGITYQHTFVQIDSNGNEVTKWNGGQIAELLANIE